MTDKFYALVTALSNLQASSHSSRIFPILDHATAEDDLDVFADEALAEALSSQCGIIRDNHGWIYPQTVSLEEKPWE